MLTDSKKVGSHPSPLHPEEIRYTLDSPEFFLPILVDDFHSETYVRINPMHCNEFALNL